MTSASHPKAPTAESLGLLVLIAVAAACGYEGHRAWQVGALALPAVLWLWWPVAHPGLRVLRATLAGVWTAMFVIDGAVRAYLAQVYGAAPDSSIVLGAVANTTAGEAHEYLGMYWIDMSIAAAAALLALLVCLALCRRIARGQERVLRLPAPRPLLVSALAVIVLASAAGYVSKPWRRWHPLVFWPKWTLAVAELRHSWTQQDQMRSRELQEAALAAPRSATSDPSTVVLVIGDSVNRDNLQLYGYARATTPMLMQRRQQLGEALTVFSDAWSAAPGTLSALATIFHFGAPDPSNSLHLLALARSAGYEVWWISNHNDLAIEQLHARFAQELRVTNRIPGRSTASLDSAVFPALREALGDASPRKLIVVHLLGAHPTYRLRYPEQMRGFQDQDEDHVDAQMRAHGRSWFLRQARTEYDNAILFHDGVVARTLDLTLDHLSQDEYGAWVYLSDHGQDVGHDADHAGHAPGTPAGYKIPALIWQNRPRAQVPADAARRSFRSDWAAWTLANLLGVDWSGELPARDVFSPLYQWQVPPLPFLPAP